MVKNQKLGQLTPILKFLTIKPKNRKISTFSYLFIYLFIYLFYKYMDRPGTLLLKKISHNYKTHFFITIKKFLHNYKKNFFTTIKKHFFTIVKKILHNYKKNSLQL